MEKGGTKTPSVLVEAEGVARAGWSELAAVDFSSPLGWFLVSPPRTRPAFGIGTGARGHVGPVVVCCWAWALGIQKRFLTAQMVARTPSPMGRESVTGPRTKQGRPAACEVGEKWEENYNRSIYLYPYPYLYLHLYLYQYLYLYLYLPNNKETKKLTYI